MDRRVVQSGKELTSMEEVAKYKDATYLDISKNKIQSIIHLPMQNLTFLNLAFNNIRIMQGLEKLVNLKALLLNNNQITRIQGLQKNPLLNTLVLSHNKIVKVENIWHLKQLQKLSLSHNQISQLIIQEPLPQLQEIRLNENKLTVLDISLNKLDKLRVLDVGKNQISNQESLLNLDSLKSVVNLNVLGNKGSFDLEEVKKVFPALKIYNSHPLEKPSKDEPRPKPPRQRKPKPERQLKLKQKQLSRDKNIPDPVKQVKQDELNLEETIPERVVEKRQPIQPNLRVKKQNIDVKTAKVIRKTQQQLDKVLKTQEAFESWD